MSLVRIIANPGSFLDSHVALIGFLHIGFEDTKLYVRRDDRTVHEDKNAIYVIVRSSQHRIWRQFSDRYVLIVGDLRPGTGHLGCCSAVLDGVTSIEPWPPDL